MRFNFKSGVDIDRAAKVVEDLAALMGVPEQAIDCVVVADNYGESIAEVLGQPGATRHTETKEMKGVGKTIPKRGTGGDVKSTIVLPSSTLQEAFAYLDPNFRGDRSVAGQYHYAISHELGHVIDYAARNTTQPASLNFDEPFRIAVFDCYWTRLLLEEFFAYAHSGKVVTDDVHREMTDQKKQGIEGFLDYVFVLLAAFRRNETDAHNLKVNVAVTYWRVLVEQAMLFGIAIGRGDDLGRVPSVWPQPNEKSKVLDAKLAATLQAFWQDYPAVDGDEAQATLGALWRDAIQVEQRHRFESRAGEDVLYVTDKLIG